MDAIFTENPGSWPDSTHEQLNGKRHRKRPNKSQATPQSDIAEMLDVLKAPAHTAHAARQSAPEPGAASTALANTRKATSAEKAERLRSEGTGAHLTAIIGSVIPDLDMDMFVAYVQAQLKDAGNPTDPLERLLIEQTLMLHHLGARFATKGCMTPDPETSAAFGMVSGKLFAEARRNVLSVAEYRDRRNSKPESNPAPLPVESANGNQVLADSPNRANGKNTDRTELGTNGKCQEPDRLLPTLAAKRPAVETVCCAVS